MRKLLVFILFLFSCSPLPPTIGKLREVIIFTEYQNEIENLISQILEKKVYTPQPEPYFTIRYKNLASFPLLKDFTTLFLVGTISDEFISDLVGDKIEIIKRDTFGFFRLKDLYTKNQQIFIFVSSEKNLLKEGLKRYEKRIFYSLLEHIYDLIHLYTYSIGIDKEKIKYLKEN